MQTVGKDIKPPKPLPLPNSDFYQLAETLPPEELADPETGALVHGEQGRANH